MSRVDVVDLVVDLVDVYLDVDLVDVDLDVDLVDVDLKNWKISQLAIDCNFRCTVISGGRGGEGGPGEITAVRSPLIKKHSLTRWKPQNGPKTPKFN